MAFGRKFLASLGIDSDKIDTIIDAHVDVVNGLKDEAEQYKAKAETADGLQKQVNDLQSKLDAADSDGYKAKYDKLSSDFNKYKSDIDNEHTLAKKKDAFKALMKASGVPENWYDRILKTEDLSSIDLNEDGTLKDADKLSDSLKSEWSEVIPTETQTGTKTSTPPQQAQKTFSRDDIKKMSADDINANWDAIKQSLNKGE